MTARWAALAALSLGWLWSHEALGDERHACLAASDKAQQLRDDGKLKAAREQMLICARDACPEAVRKDCSGMLTAVETSMPSVVLSAQDASRKDLIKVQVSLDKQPLVSSLDGRAMTIDPGPHTFHFEADGQSPVDQTVLIREGEQRRVISVVFPAKGAGAATTGDSASSPPKETEKETEKETGTTAPTRVPVAAIVVGGVGVLALGSFAYFGVTGKNDLSKLHATCGVTHTCAQDAVDATHNKLLAADLSLALGVLSLGVATGLFFALRHPATAPPKAAIVSVGAFPLGKGGGAAVSGRFW